MRHSVSSAQIKRCENSDLESGGASDQLVAEPLPRRPVVGPGHVGPNAEVSAVIVKQRLELNFGGLVDHVIGGGVVDESGHT